MIQAGMQFDEAVEPTDSSLKTCKFQDLPYDVLMLCATYASVRDILLLGTLNRFFYEFTLPSNILLWRHFTERVYLLHPLGMRQTLFNDYLLKMYASVNSIPLPVILAWDEEDVNDHKEAERGNKKNENNNGALSRLYGPAVEKRIITQWELQQWVIDHCEEALLDLRMFCDIVSSKESCFALTSLLLALQAVKKRMWYTKVMDLESVRDLLRSTIVEGGHDRGWTVLRNIARRSWAMSKHFCGPFSGRVQPDDLLALGAGRRAAKRRWRQASAVAREYLQLGEVFRVVLAVSDVSDHPNAQQRYDSVCSALRGITAMLNVEKLSQQNMPGYLDEVGAAIPMGTSGDEMLQQIRDLSQVTVGAIVNYYFGHVSNKSQRKMFLCALFSMKQLAGAERYKNTPFW